MANNIKKYIDLFNENQQHDLFLLFFLIFLLFKVFFLLSWSPVLTPTPWFNGIVPFYIFYNIVSDILLNASSTFE